MALFGAKKKTETSKKTSSKKPVVSAAGILAQPRITEKASFRMESNVYTFEVDPKSTKKEISQAVQAMYKVTPTKVRTVTIPAKSVFIRGKWGKRSGGKKAYVYLKKGETIEIM